MCLSIIMVHIWLSRASIYMFITIAVTTTLIFTQYAKFGDVYFDGKWCSWRHNQRDYISYKFWSGVLLWNGRGKLPLPQFITVIGYCKTIVPPPVFSAIRKKTFCDYKTIYGIHVQKWCASQTQYKWHYIEIIHIIISI